MIGVVWQDLRHIVPGQGGAGKFLQVVIQHMRWEAAVPWLCGAVWVGHA